MGTKHQHKAPPLHFDTKLEHDTPVQYKTWVQQINTGMAHQHSKPLQNDLTISFHLFAHHRLHRPTLKHPAILSEEDDVGGSTAARQNEGQQAVRQSVQEVVRPVHHHQVAVLLAFLPEVVLGKGRQK